MTLREFLEQNPEAVKEAANCKSTKEFEKLANAIGITFDNNKQLEEAFEIIKKQNHGQLSSEDLDAVSGGKACNSQMMNMLKSEYFIPKLTKISKKHVK